MNSRVASQTRSEPLEDIVVSTNVISALLAISFLYPIVLCAVFFPTPASDLREQINLGLTFPLHTWSNPSLHTWIAGVIALFGARDSWAYVAVAQILNFIGLAYLVRTARAFIGPDKVLPLAIMFCGSLYYSAVTPSMALNADQIQVPIAAGLFYHGLAAARDNRWRDWLAFGALSGLAVLAKYSSAVLLAAMFFSAISLSGVRQIFRNGRLYVAGALALSIMAMNINPEMDRPDVIAWAGNQFDLALSLARRGWALWHVARSLLLYDFPVALGLVILIWRGHELRPAWPHDPWQRFIVTVAVVIVTMLLLMIAVGRPSYSTRHAFPFVGIWLLALVTALDLRPKAVRDLATAIVRIWAVVLLGTLIYTQVAIQRVLREPSPAAARALQTDWNGEFACGPAYIIGEPVTARGVSIYFEGPTTGIAFHEISRSDWLVPERLQYFGAIVITTSEDAHVPALLRPLVQDSAPRTLSLPYRRTFKTSEQTYSYRFIAPHGC